MGKLAGKVAIVTGGNSGIGLSSAKEFAAEGAQVVITGRRAEVVDVAVKEIGHDAIGIVGDASDLADVDALVSQVIERFGRLDIVFANAAVNTLTPPEEVSVENFDQHFATNVRGVFFLVQKALPHLPEGSSVILAGSIAADRGLDNHSVYAATKAALRSLVRSWTHDLRGRGIRFNLVTPGPIQTPIIDKLGLTEQERAEFDGVVARKIPMGRWGQPEEVAKTALFLASSDSSFVTGGEIFVDGGMAQV